jgi:peptidoglycan hydrolase-like protein with peptidoglycan-binding domain
LVDIMITRTSAPAALRLALVSLATAAVAVSAAPRPACATFHLMNVSRVLSGWNGNAGVQAVELTMLAAGQNLVGGGVINAYNAAGTLIGPLGTFPANVANGVTGGRILCATAAFQSTFGITADLTITAGVPVGTGQVAFENAGCFVNGIAYGDVTVVKNGTTAAPALPKDLAYALVRTVSDGTVPSCPVAEDAAARIALRSGSASAPVTFTNNAGATVNVSSSLTSVDGSPRAAGVAIFPNPVRSTARVIAPGYRRLLIHDVQGRMVRILASGNERSVSPFEGIWDGRDHRGVAVASGIYFLRYDDPSGPIVRRFAVAR